jgi:PKD repeat protein
MNKDSVPPIIGALLLVVGILVIFFVLFQALTLVSGVGDFFREQFPEEEGETEGPTAAFSWSTNDLEVNFLDESEKGDAEIRHWEWNFGDGDTSNQREPTHTYNSDGNYRVRLRVEDQNGEYSTADSEISVEFGRNDGGQTEPKFGDFEISFGNMMFPLAAAILVGILFTVMLLVGGALIKAGWNLLKPGPSTLKLKIKPKKLEVEQAEKTPAYSSIPAPAATPVSAQPRPAYGPQPASAAVIGDLRSLPANNPQPAQATPVHYAQGNQMNPPQYSSNAPNAYPQSAPTNASHQNIQPPAPPTPPTEQPAIPPPPDDPSPNTEEQKAPEPTPDVTSQKEAKPVSSQPYGISSSNQYPTSQAKGGAYQRTSATVETRQKTTRKSQAKGKGRSKGKSKRKARGRKKRK